MVTVPNPDRRETIAQSLFLADTIGHMAAKHELEGPVIEVHLAPEGTDDHVEFGLSPCEARTLAGQLCDLADAAQRAGWTPAVLADVREHYLPGASDAEIITQLDGLAERLGGSPLGLRPGTVSRDAGRMLTAGIGCQLVEQASAAVDDAIGRLGEMRDAISHLTGIRNALADLQQFYRAENESKR